MMMMDVCKNCHNEPQKYYLPSYGKIFFMLILFMHNLHNYFGRIRLIMCNLQEKQTPP